ncbi:cytochrome P450 6B2-like [Cydia pomonella]|uniref:cytochrome P450 6B2-like n=1 Tax=Cydia pomonella TaxID=82600 RepID=UPI002ADE0F53|nr:cytochrome P450 6B2-like [Cydia pomonella]
MIPLIVACVVIVCCLYSFSTRGYDYWQKKGVQHEKPLPFIGSAGRIFAQKMSMTEYFTELYRKYPKEKLVGYYFSREKAVVLRDPELVKCVLITDFQYFYRRGINYHKDVVEPMFKNLFFADGDLWKLLRQRMTPAFTSGKLKAMFPLIVERTERLQRTAAATAERGAEVDVRDLMARYTTDFIGACGFGIDANSIDDEDAPFRKLGKRIFTPSLRDIIVTVAKWLAPDLFKCLRTVAPEVEQDTLSLVRSIMEQRNYQPSGRNDFIDLLLELKQKGKIVGESIEHRNSDGTSKIAELELDNLLMAAQVFVFFAAGFETSSSATSYTLHQLALHPDQQAKCQQEIDGVLTRYGGKLCYEAVNEMKYLKMCFYESMRLFPSLGFLIRKCAKPYTFPGTDVSIDEGIAVIIPVQGLQTDEQYFDEPEQFRPERFHPDNRVENHVYLPFGEGPRACIGERLGLMQSLAGLAALLRQCSVAPSISTKRNPPKEPTGHVVQSLKGGVPLLLKKRKIYE